MHGTFYIVIHPKMHDLALIFLKGLVFFYRGLSGFCPCRCANRLSGYSFSKDQKS